MGQETELTDEQYATLLKRMSEHDFTIVSMEDEVYEGQLLFANDSVLGLWMDRDSIIDFDRLSEKTIRIVYYYDIRSVREGTSYHKKLFEYKAEIFGDYDNYQPEIYKINKLSLYRWFIPEPLIDYAEETMY